MPKIGITMGDPAGIGYEITAKTIIGGRFPIEDIVLIGNKDIFYSTAAKLKLDTGGIDTLAFADVPTEGLTFESMKFGIAQRETGLLCIRTIERAVKLALSGQIEGICTAPIHRDALALAGSEFKDHTSMLTSLTSSTDVTTIYELKKLRTMLLSRHVSIANALRLITTDNIKKYIQLADMALRLLGSQTRRIAVSALNPHGGEDGLTGDTEKEVITPAIEAMSSDFDVHGPVPADVVYHQSLNGSYDIVLSLYHDQAHIALKTFDFYRTIDMNIGLPFLRVSVDHGPGYDRAGKGTGIETNMIEALDKTMKYAAIYRKAWREIREK